VQHALGFGRALRAISEADSVDVSRLIDLGSGGGLPGLVLGLLFDDLELVLLDASSRSVDFLRYAGSKLGMESKVTVCHERAEIAGRDPSMRGMFDVVTARSFGRPAVTAECGAPFLKVGGYLVVSEPPEPRGSSRWPSGGPEMLGLEDIGPSGPTSNLRLLRQSLQCPEAFARRVGIPEKRPLF